MNDTNFNNNNLFAESRRMFIDIDNMDISSMGYYELINVLKTLADDEKIKLFNRIVKKIQENPENSYENNLLILSLPPEIRIKYVEYYNFKMYNSISEFVDGMTNENDIFSATKVGLNKTDKKNIYSIINLFTKVPNNRKIEFLELISIKEKELQADIINSSNIVEYLNQFNIEQRLDVIKNVIFRYFQVEYEENYMSYVPNVRFNSYNYSNILSALSDENVTDLSQSKMFKTLVFLTEESKKIRDRETNEIVGIPNSGSIVAFFYKCGYNPNKIIEFLINNDVVDKDIGLNEIAEKLPIEARKNVITYMINLKERKMTSFEFFNSLEQLPENDAKEFFIKYCLIDKKIDYLYAINRLPMEEGYSGLYYLNIIFEKLSPEELDTSFEEIRNAFLEIVDYPKYNEKYKLIITVFSKRYNIDENKLLPFIEKFGYNILKYLGNENIVKFINTDYQLVEKLFNLFENNTIKINKSVTNDILNSLLQRQFMYEEHKIYNIFSTFENMVQNNDLNGIKELLKKIYNEFDINIILQKNNSSLDNLYNKVSTGNLDLLHTITNNYIAYKREKFVKEKLLNVGELLSMKKVITRDSYKSDIIKNYPFIIAENCKSMVNVKFTKEQRYLIDNNDLIWELIQFKRDPKGYNLDNKYKRYLKVLNELLDIMYDNKVYFINYKENYPFNQHLKFEYVQGEVSNDFLIGILLESNYEGVMNLLSNDTNYVSLKSFLERYKMIGWQDMFSKLMTKCDLQFDEGTIASLISNYDKIKPHIDNKTSLTSIIDHANCYSTISSFYSILFGKEDYNLLVANAGKNKASMSKYDRLNGCRELLPLMYAKKSFTIPTLDEIFTLSNGNQIQIVLGNATNMINLTYGERTESCMRKGGAFNNLFEYCATDKNGFHVRFVNPKTGNFVSRVSGIRNGNTVFLNELRNSLDSEYSNEDLYKAIKMLSNHLICLSKDSELPIDNIVVTSNYALEGHKEKNQSLNLSPEEIKIALRGISFNFSDSCILLASSGNDKKILPYIFSDNVPNYDSVRDKSKVYYGNSAVRRMIQIKMINDIINGVPQENINTEFVGELPDYVISGEDYYIAYRKENIDTFILDSCKENERTIDEVNSILKNNTNGLDKSISKGVSRQ